MYLLDFISENVSIYYITKTLKYYSLYKSTYSIYGLCAQWIKLHSYSGVEVTNCNRNKSLHKKGVVLKIGRRFLKLIKILLPPSSLQNG